MGVLRGRQRLALRVLAPLFERYDVALHLSGHDHVQQLYARAGVGYAISGAGGAELDDEPLANAAETKAQHDGTQQPSVNQQTENHVP